ncbi:MAG TPA: tetratricopeptide repeat protein [Sandaracinaceae bacterium]
MSLDRTKVLEAAQKHLAKGNYEKAIVELQKLVAADPTDVRTLLKIGDLYTRKGSRREAIETYGRVAAQYAQQGFFLKAVAVYKQIIKLDPSRLDVQLKLAEMYEMLQLTSDALTTYEHVAASYARAGDVDRALSTLAKMTEIDPENIPVRIKYAEALSKAGRTKDAADAFEVGAQLLEQQGRIDDFIKVAERLLYHRPDDAKLARKLAALYLERNDPKRALSKLQLCFKADPKDTETLELLAEAFNQLGQLPKTISVYREIARIHHEANRHEERARTLKKILELDPGDAEARQALASFAASGVRRDIAPPASAVVEPSRPQVRAASDAEDEELDELDDLAAEEEVEVLADDEDEDDLIIVEEEPEPAAPSAPPEVRSVPPDVQREAQIARLLTECDVFMRYGLKAKVAEQLKAVLEIEPRHVEARERLKDLYLSQGKIREAIEELWRLAELFAEEQSAAAVLYLKQILELDPAHEQARARLTAMGVRSVPPPQERAPEPAPASEPAAEDDILFLDEDTSEPERTASSAPAFAADSVEAQIPTTATDAPALDLEEDDLLVSPRRAIVPPPSTVEQPLDLEPARAVVPPPSQVMDPLAPMTPEEFEQAPLRPSSPGEMAAEVARRSVAPGEVEELLDEADFFVAQGLFEEARLTLVDALSTHPGHPLIEEKLREVGALAAAAAAERTAAAAPPSDQSFELAEKLAAELEEEPTDDGSDVLDVEEVFAQFKKGVEQQVGMEDTETHFDLGIAYKEMGLLDDAINEFRLCLSNPQRVCIAETMIGLCYIEKGDVPEAIAHFKKGLYAETKTDREELGLYFELGNAYELLHDPKEALYYYQKVQKRDPTFRDVGRRIQNLAAPHLPARAAAPMAPDDIDRAFDDLVGED